MRRMQQPDSRDTATLIADIVERFHEGHRRALPALIAQARASSPPLAAALESLAAALEAHMFKEEMRLFPMMEQGGHSLVGLLIDDIEAEHRAHEHALAALAGPMQADLPDALRAGLDHFIGELQAHVRAEDEVLFPRFPRNAAARALL